MHICIDTQAETARHMSQSQAHILRTPTGTDTGTETETATETGKRKQQVKRGGGIGRGRKVEALCR